jgi:hypothetical protein
MELIIWLMLAIAAFGTLITFVVGLVSAPTSVLMIILIAGLFLTQKSINKFGENKVSFDDKQTNNIENVEFILNTPKTATVLPNSETEFQLPQINSRKFLTYRGFNYNKNGNLKSSPLHKNSNPITYRGLPVSNSNKLNNLS